MPAARRRIPLALGAACVAVTLTGLAVVPTSTAGFRDTVVGNATVTTEVAPDFPVAQDQSAASALYVSKFGQLSLAGNRASGNGAGGAGDTTTYPTQVQFPAGTVIVDAVGATNDYDNGQQSTTSYAALDSAGQVWTWGAVLGGPSLIGRGNITLAQSYTPGLVRVSAGGAPLTGIVDIERIENQFLALDNRGTMWVWGYAAENLPHSAAANQQFPVAANTVAATEGALSCSGTNDGGTVTWHSIWGGGNAGAAVSTSGLIYTWGFDHGRLDGIQISQRCPILNDPANRALFSAYPDVYKTAEGLSYNETVLTTESQRLARYNEIVRNLRTKTMAACAGVVTKPNSDGSVADESGCYVRQLGYSARAPRLLLDNGDLYTWQVSAEGYGMPFLGRVSTSDIWSTPGSRYRPTVALSGVDYVVVGVGSAKALMRDGRVLAWGYNYFCEAIGSPSGVADCVTQGASPLVVLPTPVAGLPTNIVRIAATQCATWAVDAGGRHWAWGAGTLASYAFVSCWRGPAAPRIYDRTGNFQGSPWGSAINSTSTGTIRVR